MTKDLTKTQRLLDLVAHAMRRQRGVSLEFICQEYDVSQSTAHRMVRELDMAFEPRHLFDEEGRKFWKIDAGLPVNGVTFTAEDLAALELAQEALQNVASAETSQNLHKVAGKVRAHIPSQRMSRLDPDLEALLISQHVATRPGPEEKFEPEVLEVISYALKAQCLLQFDYVSRDGVTKTRTVAPYGLIFGQRKYLICQDPRPERAGQFPRYRIAAMTNVIATDQMFDRDEEFDLQEFAARSFGSYYDPEELDEVVLKFTGPAAARAHEFRFHPNQTTQAQDEATIVRFTASGWTEIAWHLHQWGDNVEVLGPEGLIERINNPRANALP